MLAAFFAVRRTSLEAFPAECWTRTLPKLRPRPFAKARTLFAFAAALRAIAESFAERRPSFPLLKLACRPLLPGLPLAAAVTPAPALFAAATFFASAFRTGTADLRAALARLPRALLLERPRWPSFPLAAWALTARPLTTFAFLASAFGTRTAEWRAPLPRLPRPLLLEGARWPALWLTARPFAPRPFAAFAILAR
jgi:hypothetical protein